MSFLAYGLLATEQCGECGPKWLALFRNASSRDPYWTHVQDLFGLPLVIDSSDATCTPGVGCSMVTRKRPNEADFPPWDVSKAVFARRLWPHFKLKEQLEDRREEVGHQDTLVAHLRGGDILPRRDLDYLPAPCMFIDHVIRHGNGGGSFSRTVLVSDTEDHPCIAYLQARHPHVLFDARTVEEDIVTLMSAKSIALSTSSTFGLTGMLLNPNEDVKVFLPTYTGKTLCCGGNYDADRLSELCRISPGSAVYEFSAPELGYVSSRRDWILDDAHFTGVSIHTCS